MKAGAGQLWSRFVAKGGAEEEVTVAADVVTEGGKTAAKGASDTESSSSGGDGTTKTGTTDGGGKANTGDNSSRTDSGDGLTKQNSTDAVSKPGDQGVKSTQSSTTMAEPSLSRDGLKELVERTAETPGRQKDLTEFIDMYDARQVPDQHTKELFYGQLGRLLTAEKGAFSQEERNELAEQLVKNALNPAYINLKSWSCGLGSLERRFSALSPQINAKIVADLNETGGVDLPSGLRVQLDGSGDKFGLRPDDTARADLDFDKSWFYSNQRNWASQLTQTVFGKIGWEMKTTYLDLTKQELLHANKLVFDEHGNLLGDLDFRGAGTISYHGHVINEAKPEIMELIDAGRTDFTRNDLVYDSSGNIFALVRDKSYIKPLFDKDGTALEKFSPGDTAYGADGQPTVYYARPGEVSYENRGAGGDGIYFQGADAEGRMYLKDSNGNELDRVLLPVDEIALVHKAITGDSREIALISQRPDEWVQPGTVGRMRDMEELGETLAAAKEEGQFPLILRVHVDHEPFREPFGLEEGQSQGLAGYHSLNVVDYTPESNTVVLGDQTGNSRWYYLALEDVWRVMQAPDLTP